MNDRFQKLIYIFEHRYMISLILLEILLEIKNKENGFDLYMQYNNYFLYLPTYFELTPSNLQII